MEKNGTDYIYIGSTKRASKTSWPSKNSPKMSQHTLNGRGFQCWKKISADIYGQYFTKIGRWLVKFWLKDVRKSGYLAVRNTNLWYRKPFVLLTMDSFQVFKKYSDAIQILNFSVCPFIRSKICFIKELTGVIIIQL